MSHFIEATTIFPQYSRRQQPSKPITKAMPDFGLCIGGDRRGNGVADHHGSIDGAGRQRNYARKTVEGAVIVQRFSLAYIASEGQFG